MRKTFSNTLLYRALSVAMLGMASHSLLAQEQARSNQASQTPADAETQAAAAPAQSSEVTDLDQVSVTGYRRSLQFSTDAKRDVVGFTDSIFAEDIGKFPDLNIAESLNRIPGIPYAQLKGEERGQYDLAASYMLWQLHSSPQILLNLVNITGESRRSNFYWSNAVNDYYGRGRTVMSGIRGTF